MNKDNEIRLGEQTEAKTTEMEKRENYIPDHVNAEAYKERANDMNMAQEIGMHANWDSATNEPTREVENKQVSIGIRREIA